jgi:hypothetical protein
LKVGGTIVAVTTEPRIFRIRRVVVKRRCALLSNSSRVRMESIETGGDVRGERAGPDRAGACMMLNIQNLIDDAKCYESVRSLRWPDGVRCVHCDPGSIPIRTLVTAVAEFALAVLRRVAFETGFSILGTTPAAPAPSSAGNPDRFRYPCKTASAVHEERNQ